MNWALARNSAACAVIGVAAILATLAIGQPSGNNNSPPAMQLPPGWTEADIQKCMAAGTPGKQHDLLASGVGEWEGKSTMWMAPGMEPIVAPATASMTPILEGRFIQLQFKGDMPGMGPYTGLAVYGFDNVSKKFVSNWIDNQGTGMMRGEGELSPDGRSLHWVYTYYCPISEKPTVMREIETLTGPDSRTIEAWGTDPKSGKEYKMMVIELKRKK